jgi:hypothetical protein
VFSSVLRQPGHPVDDAERPACAVVNAVATPFLEPRAVPGSHRLQPFRWLLWVGAPRADGRLSRATSTAVVEEALKPNVDDKPLDEQAFES